MRKIKITALVLAVLMVMAAFAGCASKSAVEDLDERVTALEGKIDANQKANEDKIDELAALIEALTKSQTDIKESVDANKKDQASSNQAILDAINKLTEKVDQVEKDQAAADKADVDYVVVAGDTVSKIAIRYGLDWKELAQYNKLANPNLIYVGQTLKIPQ